MKFFGLTGLQLELFKKIKVMSCNPVVKSNPGCLIGLLNWVATQDGLQPEFSNPKTTQPLKNPNQ